MRSRCLPICCLNVKLWYWPTPCHPPYIFNSLYGNYFSVNYGECVSVLTRQNIVSCKNLNEWTIRRQSINSISVFSFLVFLGRCLNGEVVEWFDVAVNQLNKTDLVGIRCICPTCAMEWNRDIAWNPPRNERIVNSDEMPTTMRCSTMQHSGLNMQMIHRYICKSNWM